MLAGMNVAAGPDLAAAVSNAGGIGVLGGVGELLVSLSRLGGARKAFDGIYGTRQGWLRVARTRCVSLFAAFRHSAGVRKIVEWASRSP